MSQRSSTRRACRRRPAPRPLSTAVALVVLAASVAAAEPSLAVRRSGPSLTVSFDLRPTRADDLAGRLRGVAPVSVTWRIDVRHEVPFWVDRGVERFTLEVTARRTATPGAFLIERTLNGRTLGAPVLASLDDVYRALTSFAEVELPNAAPVGLDAPYRLAIAAQVAGGGEARIATSELARTVIAP